MKLSDSGFRFNNVTTDDVVAFGVNYYFAKLLGAWMIISAIVLILPAYEAYQNYKTYVEAGGSSLQVGYVHRIRYDAREKCVALQTVGDQDVQVIDTGRPLRADNSADARCDVFGKEVAGNWKARAESNITHGPGDYILAGLFAVFILGGALLLSHVLTLFLCLIIRPLFPFYRQITLLVFIVPAILCGILVRDSFKESPDQWVSSTKNGTIVYVNRVFIHPETGYVYKAPKKLYDWSEDYVMKRERE